MGNKIKFMAEGKEVLENLAMGNGKKECLSRRREARRMLEKDHLLLTFIEFFFYNILTCRI